MMLNIGTRMMVGVIAAFTVGMLCGGCLCEQPNEESHPKIQRIEKQLDGGGRVVFDGYYKDGRAVEHGKSVIFYAGGSRFEVNCCHGIMDGKCSWYYPDGSLGFEGTYRKGKPWDGVAIPTDMRGELPHKYMSGKDGGVWQDPKGIWVDE